jgi:hypothetical protein
MVKCAPAARGGLLRGRRRRKQASFAAEVNVSGAAAKDITVAQRLDSLHLRRSRLGNLDPGTTRTASAQVLVLG